MLFVGRNQELAELAARFDAAVLGKPQIAVVHGSEGMGKSSLVEHYLRRLEGFPVLRGSGARWESGVQSGVLDQLLRGTGQSPADDDWQQAGRQLLKVMDRDDDGPVILVVENLQWVDTSTLRALLHAVRRLDSEMVFLIVTINDEESFQLPEGCRDLLSDPIATHVRAGPLSAADIQTLSTAVIGVDLSGPAAHQLAAHTGGNPRYTRQLLEETPAGVWREGSPQLPAPKCLTLGTAGKLAQLAAETRALVEAAAVLGMRCTVADAAALGGISEPLVHVDEACDAGILTVSGYTLLTVSFPNPLLHTAVYRSMGQIQRTGLHRAAAAVVDNEGTNLRHRVAATPLPDKELAAELEAFAERQAELGAWSTVADALLQAGQLYPTRTGRETRLLRALDAMIGAGELPRALTYMQEVESFAPSPLREAVTGYLAMLQGRKSQAEVLLDTAWKQCDPAADGPTAALIAQRCVLHSLGRWDGDALIKWAERAVSLAVPDSPAAIESRAIAGLGVAAMGRTGEAEVSYAELSGRDDLGAQLHRVQMARGWLHLAADQPETAHDELSSAVSTEFRMGSFRISLWARAWCARTEFTTGAWDAALETVERGFVLQESVGMDLLRPLLHWTATQIHALRGDWELAEDHLRRGSASTQNYPIMQLPACMAKAHFAEAKADYDGVLRAFEPVLRLDRSAGLDEPGFWPWQDTYANALVMTDRAGEASDFLAPLEHLAQARQHRSTMARLAYVRGRIQGAEGDIEKAAETFEGALAQLDSMHMPYLRGRVKFAYGQTLRRAGKRRHAAAMLTEARDAFASIGAETYVDRSARELQATGVNMSRRDFLDFSGLTAQEQAVANLVADGASNKQAALELYVSVKTIQYHLTRTYAKLGISSRSELAAHYRQPPVTAAVQN